MAHTKAKSTTKNGRDSNPKYRGVKRHDGESVIIGNVLVRQTGSSVWAGNGVNRGSDYTLTAGIDGKVKFTTRKKTSFTGRRRAIKIINVISQ